jgi:hypothetical protein
MKRTILSLTIAAIAFTACNQTDKKEEATSAIEATTQKTVEIKSPVMANYINVERALVNDDAKTAADAGKTLAESIINFDESSLNESQKAAFINIKEDALEHAENISTNSDNIDQQREHFKMLSEKIYIMAKNVDPSQTFYKVSCPMYKEGSYWLSATNEVSNPFYGASMLSCGSVDESIN